MSDDPKKPDLTLGHTKPGSDERTSEEHGLASPDPVVPAADAPASAAAAVEAREEASLKSVPYPSASTLPAPASAPGPASPPGSSEPRGDHHHHHGVPGARSPPMQGRGPFPSHPAHGPDGIGPNVPLGGLDPLHSRGHIGAGAGAGGFGVVAPGPGGLVGPGELDRARGRDGLSGPQIYGDDYDPYNGDGAIPGVGGMPGFPGPGRGGLGHGRGGRGGRGGGPRFDPYGPFPGMGGPSNDHMRPPGPRGFGPGGAM